VADDQYRRFSLGLHRLLLRVAGRVPDEWLTDMRRRLGGGELLELPDHLTGGLGELGVPVTPGEIALLREMTRSVYGRDPVWLESGHDLAVDGQTPPTEHSFRPVPPDLTATDGDRMPPHLDLTGRPGDDLWELPPGLAALSDVAMRLTDAEDESMLVELSATDGVRSVARAWRSDGVRVVLVEVDDAAPAWEITWSLQGWFERAGHVGVGIETYGTSTELTPYHRTALAGSALLWTAERNSAGRNGG
jgi:hypothetical protein